MPVAVAAPASFLAVEDDPDVQRAILKAVKGDFAVQFAGSGRQALEVLSTSPLPRFVLLDFMLPDMEGLEVLRHVRKDPRTRLLPVVLFSSVTDQARQRASLEAGANSWVGKPDDPRVFADSVREVCRYWTRLHLTPPLAN